MEDEAATGIGFKHRRRSCRGTTRLDGLRRSLASYGHGKAEFSDYLIGATTTYTFDRDLRGSNDFTLLQG